MGSSGTPHLQGYIHYANKKTRRQVSKDIGKAYVDIRNGSIQQAIDYCQKDGDFTELGKKPLTQSEKGQTEKDRWQDITSLAKEGNLIELESKYPKEYLLYRPRLLSIYQLDRKPLDGELPHEWWTGLTGTGKSRTLWELYPNHFAKTLNKWWDNYAFQDVVVIEEWSPRNECTASFLKVWADRYPFPCEVKGAVLPMIRPRKIIVLSNYTIQQCFPAKEDCDPLLRRFKTIEFPQGKLHAQARVNNFIPLKADKPVPIAIPQALPDIETDIKSEFQDFNFRTSEIDDLLRDSSPSSLSPWDFPLDGSFNLGWNKSTP